MIAWLLWSIAVAQARCPSFAPGPPDAAFTATTDAAVIVELWLEDPALWPMDTVRSALTPLDQRGLRATVLVSKRWADETPGGVAWLTETQHQIGLIYDASLALNTSTDVAMRQPVATHRQLFAEATSALHHPRVVGLRPLSPAAEIALNEAGVRVILPLDARRAGPPRRGRSYDDQPGRSRVLPTHHRDGCGVALPEWSPAALDRALAENGNNQPLRLSLPSPPNPSLLARWLDEVQPRVRPAGAAAREARVPLPGSGPVTETPTLPPYRDIPRTDLLLAAAALSDVQRLPRTLHAMTPTELLLGLAATVSSPPTTDPVAIPAATPFLEPARSSLTGPTPVDAEALLHVCARLGRAGGVRIAALYDVGGVELTAGEMVTAIGAMIEGNPPVARPIADPDPYAEGAGWGESTGLTPN